MPWMTAAEVAAKRPGIADADDADIDALVLEFEELAERYLGVAYVNREDTYEGYATDGILRLPHVKIVSIEVLTDENANDLTYTLFKAMGDVQVYHSGLILVEYTHGFTAPTNRLLSACARWVERMIVLDRTGTSRDTLTQSFEGGTTRYSTPDWNAGRPTGFLQIDADLNAERSYLLRVA